MAGLLAGTFIRSPYVIAYWSGDGGFVVEHARRRSHIAGGPEIAAVLDAFGTALSLARLQKALPQFAPSALARVMRLLVDTGMIEPASTVARVPVGWQSWMPAAGWFHLATKDQPYVDRAAALRIARVKARLSPAPPPIKRYRGVPRVPLPPPETGGEFTDVVLGRRTWRQFSREPMTLQALGTLLHLTWGIQRWMTLPRAPGAVPLKTSPSAGARHPIEAYVVARRVRGLPSALYHYRPDVHALERIGPRASAARFSKYLPQQPWYQQAAALCVMTAVFARDQWRYKTSRAYRAVLLDAGHLCQTFCLAATWLRLAPFCTMAMADSLLEEDLGVDGLAESALYIAGVGTRPEGEAFASLPDFVSSRRAVLTKGRPGSAPRQRSRRS